ncbi:MAG: hypothetical protein IPJ54_04690 [Saprospiraceae bacterium]|nr:hypothetical protein [Saprospiraceae bacterium]
MRFLKLNFQAIRSTLMEGILFLLFLLSFRSMSAQTAVNLNVTNVLGTEAAMTVVTVTVTASAAVVGNQTVDLSVMGSNISPSDYSLSSTSITLLDGMTSGSVSFTINDDGVMESLETAVLTISNPSSGIILGTTTSQLVHIEDNDIVNTATLYNKGYMKNNALVKVQGKPMVNTGTIKGTGTFDAAYVNTGVLSPGNN